MRNLTPSSWLKIALIALLCLVLCTGVSGCFVGLQRSVNAAVGTALRHHGAISDASSFSKAGGNRFAPDEVRTISIDWLAGEVEVVATDDSACDGMIVVQETSRRWGSDIPENERLRWKLEDGDLSLIYNGGAFGWNDFGLGGCSASSKTLTVMVPFSCARDLGALSITGASGRYTLTDIGCDELELDLASGEASGTGLSAQMLDLTMASGNVALEGAFSGQAFFDIMSGGVDVTCTGACPSAVDIDMASGRVQFLTPPEHEQGYTVNVDRISGGFTCPRAQQQNGLYVVGDGSATFNVDMTSGNITID